MKYIKILLFLLLIFSVSSVHALDLSITDKGAEAYLHGEFNRGSVYNGSLSIIGDIELNSLWLFRGGLSFGTAGDVTDLKAFTTARASPFENLPLRFSLSWIYNGFIEYEAHAHSIFPLISYGTDKAGISLGMHFRFTSYFGEEAQFESILAFLLYYNFINNETLRVGASFGTFDDFNARNLGAFALGFDFAIRINENWQIISKIDIMQSGAEGLSANFFGFAWKGGVRFTW